MIFKVEVNQNKLHLLANINIKWWYTVNTWRLTRAQKGKYCGSFYNFWLSSHVSSYFKFPPCAIFCSSGYRIKLHFLCHVYYDYPHSIRRGMLKVNPWRLRHHERENVQFFNLPPPHIYMVKGHTLNRFYVKFFVFAAVNNNKKNTFNNSSDYFNWIWSKFFDN